MSNLKIIVLNTNVDADNIFCSHAYYTFNFFIIHLDVYTQRTLVLHHHCCTMHSAIICTIKWKFVERQTTYNKELAALETPKFRRNGDRGRRNCDQCSWDLCSIAELQPHDPLIPFMILCPPSPFCTGHWCAAVCNRLYKTRASKLVLCGVIVAGSVND